MFKYFLKYYELFDTLTNDWYTETKACFKMDLTENNTGAQGRLANNNPLTNLIHWSIDMQKSHSRR